MTILHRMFSRTSAITIVCLIISTSQGAMATTTGISALDTGVTNSITVIQGIAGLAVILGIGTSIWHVIAHHETKRALIEFIGSLICGIIAYNAKAIATFFNIGGTMIQ